MAAIAAPCDAPEHREFDFWLGQWQVHTPEGSVRQLWETTDTAGQWTTAFEGRYTRR